MIEIIKELIDAFNSSFELQPEIENIDGEDILTGLKIKDIKNDCSSFVEQLFDMLSKVVENYSESYKELMATMGEEYDLNDYFNELKSEAGLIGRIYVRVYLYKGELAAVEVENYERDIVRLELLGGNYRTQNWRIVDGITNIIYMEQESSIKGKKEEFVWFSGNDRLGEIEYDRKTGALEIQIGDYKYTDLIFSGTFLKKKGQYVLEIDDIQAGSERIDLRGTISFSDKPKIEKPGDGGKVFDIGNASEAEWQLLIKEISSGKFGNMIEDTL